jgi:indoleamine 2,3-dioxygenase
MVQNSGPLIDGVVSALDACTQNNREAFNTGLEKIVQSMVKVNRVMDG